MNITEEVKQKAHILRLVGRLEFKARIGFNETVEKAIQSGATHIILNLKGVPYLDSAGLGLLANLDDQLRAQNKKASLVYLQENVEKVLLLARLDAKFNIYRTEEEALAGRHQPLVGAQTSSGS